MAFPCWGYYGPVTTPKPIMHLVRGSDPAALSAQFPDDAHLLAAVRSGNTAMAGAFHDRTRRVIERTVARLLGPSDSDFDDLVQVSMIELLGSLHRFRGECSLDTWAAAVASRLVYKHLRRRGLENSLFAPELPESQCRTTQQQPILRALISKVCKHLQQISPERAWAFLLHDVYGYSLEEIAEMTGTSLPAAQSRIFRGRREMHQLVANDPDLAGGLDSMEGSEC
jgi:RNA polymerase sigma-70 factor (ECF subfamily)